VSKKAPPAADEIPIYFGLTANQVVSYNLARAREWKGWTQDQAAEALAPHLGFRWSKASFSAAERSVDGERIRQFDADEIVAFARTFDLPVSWFFMPPPPWASPGIPAKLRTPDAERFGSPLALLADLVFGDDQARALLTLRLQAFLEELGPNPLTDAQHRVAELVQAKKAQLVHESVADLGRWQIQLRALANHLEDLEQRAASSALQALDHSDTPTTT
jgi:hypothetical protein